MNKTLVLKKIKSSSKSYVSCGATYFIGLCCRSVNRFWAATRGSDKIRVKVSKARPHENSIPVKVQAALGFWDHPYLHWTTSKKRNPERSMLSSNVCDWLTSRYPSIKDGEVHTIYVSVTPI